MPMPAAHQDPEQGRQETGLTQHQRSVRPQIGLLSRRHPAVAHAFAALRACENVKQLVGAGSRFVGQEPLRHIPAIGGSDLEHLLRQGRKAGAGLDERIEILLLFDGHLGPAQGKRLEFLLIERPQLLIFLLEGRIGRQEVGADGADRHRHAATQIGVADQQALARVGRWNGTLLVDDRGRFLQHQLGERRGLDREDLGRRLLIGRVRDHLGLVLGGAQFIEQRLGLLPVQLVLLDGPMAGETVHLRTAFLDLFPEHTPLSLEGLVSGN